MADLPLVVDVLEVRKEDENAYILQLGMNDGRAYFVRIMATAAEKLGEALQALLPKERPRQMASRLTIGKVSTGELSSGEPALLLETLELGPVQIPLGLNGLDDLRSQLDELHAKRRVLTTKH